MQLITSLVALMLAIFGGFGYMVRQTQKGFKRLQDRIEVLQKKLDTAVDQDTCQQRRCHYVTVVSFQEQINRLTLSIQRLTRLLESRK